jgi:hypothetical protein
VRADLLVSQNLENNEMLLKPNLVDALCLCWNVEEVHQDGEGRFQG